VNGKFEEDEILPFKPFVDKIEFVNKPLGPSAAKNRVIGMASHPWVVLLDSDDYLVPTALLIYERAIQNHPDIDVAFEYSGINFLKSNFSYPPNSSEFNIYFWTQVGLIPQTGACGHATLVRRDCSYRFNEDVDFAEERDLAIRMWGAGGTAALLQSCTYVYNWNETGISSHSEKLTEAQKAVLDEIRKPLKSMAIEDMRFRIVELPFLSKEDKVFIERIYYLEKMNG